MTTPSTNPNRIEVEYNSPAYWDALEKGYVTSTVDYGTGIAVMVPHN